MTRTLVCPTRSNVHVPAEVLQVIDQLSARSLTHSRCVRQTQPGTVARLLAVNHFVVANWPEPGTPATQINHWFFQWVGHVRTGLGLTTWT